MENQNLENANDYIEHQYEKFYGEADKSSFPETLTEEFDMKSFGNNCTHRDVYNLLMRSNPLGEFESFYEVLDSRDKDKIKSLSFSHSESVQERYHTLYDAMIKCAQETSETVIPTGEPLDSSEFDFIVFVDVLYSNEYERIIGLMKNLTTKCSDVVSSIDSLNEEEIDAKQVEILMLLEDIRDNKAVDPVQLMKGAASIFRQTRMNVVN